MLTTVPSMNAILEPRMVAASTQIPVLAAQGASAGRASSQGARAMLARWPPRYPNQRAVLAGNLTKNVEPLPSVLSTHTRPPWAWIVCFTMASPRPLPGEERARSPL